MPQIALLNRSPGHVLLPSCQHKYATTIGITKHLNPMNRLNVKLIEQLNITKKTSIGCELS